MGVGDGGLGSRELSEGGVGRMLVAMTLERRVGAVEVGRGRREDVGNVD